jgi:NAD(P)-dependent dehydrogenase (short-subunit alcohol dehydrogenase family)
MYKGYNIVMNNSPVVIVTGASRGLGAAVAGWLAKVGAGLTLVARSEGDLNRLAEDLGHAGGGPLVCRADISDYDACRKAVENTLERFGRIDSLVNNAGIVQPIAAISDSDPADWRYNLEVNLIGPFNLITGNWSSPRYRPAQSPGWPCMHPGNSTVSFLIMMTRV